MEIWLDTAEFELVQYAKEMGILHGVTTNPSIVAKSKMALEELLIRLLEIQSGPVTAQVTVDAAAKMIEQGEALYHFSDRMVVKIPVTQEGIRAIYCLSLKKIPVMATAVFDANQVLLAARAGATYIAPYFSSMCDLDISGFEQFKAMLSLVERYKYTSKILGASLKSAEQVKQCAEMGVHAVTLNKEVFLSFIHNHPETMKKIDKFSKDWKTAKERRSLPF